ENYGHISSFNSTFSPLQVGEDRITITKRVSYDEPFLDSESRLAVELYFYANFSDPVRPVYFAPGLLLQTPDIQEMRRAPQEEDFVQHEFCIVDCPGEVRWQYATQRRSNDL